MTNKTNTIDTYSVAEKAFESLDSYSTADQIAQKVIETHKKSIETHKKSIGVDNYGELPVITGFVLDLIALDSPTGQWESNGKQAIKTSVVNIIGTFLDENKVDFDGNVN